MTNACFLKPLNLWSLVMQHKKGTQAGCGWYTVAEKWGVLTGICAFQIYPGSQRPEELVAMGHVCRVFVFSA